MVKSSSISNDCTFWPQVGLGTREMPQKCKIEFSFDGFKDFPHLSLFREACSQSPYVLIMCSLSMCSFLCNMSRRQVVFFIICFISVSFCRQLTPIKRGRT